MSWLNEFIQTASAWVTFIGFIVGLIGVYLTYRQAHEARVAAQAARIAAEAAGKKVIGFDASVSIYNAVEILQRVCELVGQDQLDEAMWKCVDVRKILERAVNADLDEISESPVMSAASEYLNVLTNNLMVKCQNPHVDIDLVQVRSDLLGHIVAMSGLCERLRQREVQVDGR